MGRLAKARHGSAGKRWATLFCLAGWPRLRCWPSGAAGWERCPERAGEPQAGPAGAVGVRGPPLPSAAANTGRALGGGKQTGRRGCSHRGSGTGAHGPRCGLAGPAPGPCPPPRAPRPGHGTPPRPASQFPAPPRRVVTSQRPRRPTWRHCPAAVARRALRVLRGSRGGKREQPEWRRYASRFWRATGGPGSGGRGRGLGAGPRARAGRQEPGGRRAEPAAWLPERRTPRCSCCHHGERRPGTRPLTGRP